METQISQLTSRAIASNKAPKSIKERQSNQDRQAASYKALSSLRAIWVIGRVDSDRAVPHMATMEVPEAQESKIDV